MIETQVITEFFGITGNPKEPCKRLEIRQLGSTASALQGSGGVMQIFCIFEG